MTDLLKFVAVVALGLFTAWIAHQWIGIFENIYVAAAIWLTAFGLIAFIYDRRQSRHRSNSANSAPD